MPKPLLVEDNHGPVHAQLFMVRMWREDLGEGRSEWRGKVQHVISGEARYFRDWPALIACLQEMVSDQSNQS